MASKTVVLGGGTGGVVAAHRLARELRDEHRVVLVDREPVYRFAPSFLWVMTGARRPEQVSVDLRRAARRGVELLQTEAQAIDTDTRHVETASGTIGYDRLVIALGAELVPEALPGFAEAAHNVYTLEGAVAAARALQEFKGGRVVVLVSRLPYKCPAAPYETALLAEALLRRRGVRASIDVYTPEPFPMPTAGPAVGEALKGVLGTRGIAFHPERSVERIEPEAHELVLAGGERVPYDLLLAVPPHRAPAVARESGLAAESGFLPVDRATLATKTEGVYAIGDVTAIANRRRQVPAQGGRLRPRTGQGRSPPDRRRAPWSRPCRALRGQGCLLPRDG